MLEIKAVDPLAETLNERRIKPAGTLGLTHWVEADEGS